MDHSDRIRSLRRTAGLRRGRLDRRPAARLAALVLAAGAAMTALVLPGTPAWAHNALAESTPAKGAVVEEAPKTVKLRFLEKLNADFTTITVSTEAKQKVAAADPKVDGATATLALTDPLVNGKYTVAYRVVSHDGHTVQGSYDFTVNDPAAAAPAPASVPPSSAAVPSAAPATSAAAAPGPATEKASSESSMSGGAVAGIVVAVVIGAGGVAYFLFRRRSS
ncbi:copper resistance protein CopC [Actinoplanes sp. NPDC051859]|uniref:copper resistance protein CopC n=1 Tax=Actinoplanes sp. NPDC051859 TaxID=3363909 RepID=UPI00378CEE7B